MDEVAYVRPVEAVSVADRVTSEIRRAIIAGRLPPGQEFSLRGIAGQLGVSFIPVREALRSLEAEGLLVTRPGRSATVAPLSADELHSLCGLRRRIEPDLAARSCPELTAARLDALEATSVAAHADHSEPERRYDAHLEVLGSLMRPAASDWDLRMLRVLWRATERYLWFGCEAGGEESVRAARRMLDAVRDLLAGFRTGEPDSARAAVLRHIDWAEDAAARGLPRRNGQSSRR